MVNSVMVVGELGIPAHTKPSWSPRWLFQPRWFGVQQLPKAAWNRGGHSQEPAACPGPVTVHSVLCHGLSATPGLHMALGKVPCTEPWQSTCWGAAEFASPRHFFRLLLFQIKKYSHISMCLFFSVYSLGRDKNYMDQVLYMVKYKIFSIKQ